MTTNFKVKEIKQTKEGELTQYTNGYQKLFVANWKDKGQDREFWFKPSRAKEVPDSVVKNLLTPELIQEFAEKITGDVKKQERIKQATQKYGEAIFNVFVKTNQWIDWGNESWVGSFKNLKHDIDYLCDNYLGKHNYSGDNADLQEMITQDQRDWLKEQLIWRAEDELNDLWNAKQMARAGY